MPIDPTIFLRGYRGAVDPNEALLRAEALRRSRQQGVLQDQNIQEGQMRLSELGRQQQRQTAMEGAARNAFVRPAPVTTQQPTINVGSLALPGGSSTVQGPAQFDPSAYSGNLTDAGYPMEAMDFQQKQAAQEAAQRKAQAEIEHVRAQTLNQLSQVPGHQIDAVAKRLDALGIMLTPMLQVPDDQAQQVWEQNVLPQVAQMSGWTPDIVEQHRQVPGKDQILAQVAGTKAGVEFLKQKQDATRAEFETKKFEETKRHNVAMEKKPTAAAAPGATGNDPKDIAAAIIRGELPPTTKGLYRNAAPVLAELARNGYNLQRAESDWNAVQKHLSTLNGTQQERLRQAITFTYDSLDNIEQLYNEWKQQAGVSGYKILNKANLALMKQLPGKAGATAQALEAQINDLTSELGTVYKGGNGSTDESLRLAAENLKSNWNDETFTKNLGQVRKNLGIRKNSILNSQPAGIRENSPYVDPAKSSPSAVTKTYQGVQYVQQQDGSWKRQ